MEAMAAGLPVVCSKIRGNVDLIAEGKGGYLIDPTDINGFAQAIRKLSKSKKLCLNMGEMNEREISNYDLKVVNDIMHDIYSL